jgi:proteasome lid subunit RPN8/RPN11
MVRSAFGALVRTTGRLLAEVRRGWQRQGLAVEERRPAAPVPPKVYQRLERVTLTDEVSRTLFEEYAAHRDGPRGHEETGWVILGLREADEAVALATLPAGAESSAGIAHVRFNTSAQALGSRIVRQTDRRLTILGVVHTHPGSLRHPSDEDYRGDVEWVNQLRGGEGVFGIGTADDKGGDEELYARQPRPHVQCLGPLCLSWYVLGSGDRNYRPLAYGLTLGPDLARPLHSIWSTVEAHAERLDRLFRQQSGVRFEVVKGQKGPALAVTLPLAEAGGALRVLLEEEDVRYFVVRNGEVLAPESREPLVDRGVYLLLAELAGQR